MKTDKIAQRVKELREAKGWTRRRLSIESGVTEKTILNVENGDGCTLTSLRKLAEGFNIELIGLLE